MLRLLSRNTALGRGKAPQCGRNWEDRNVAVITVTEPVHLMPSDYFLDTFVAHRISSLTECGAPELPGEGRWLNAYILNSSMMSDLRGERRTYAFNLIRLTEGAFS